VNLLLFGKKHVTNLYHSVVRRSSHGASHIGRGGNGNVFNPEDAKAAKKEQENGGSAVADDTSKPNLLEKGKAFLFGKK